MHYCFILIQIKSWPSDCYEVSALGVLLRRMLFLVAPDHQASMVPASSIFNRRDLNQWPVSKYPLSALQKLQDVEFSLAVLDITLPRWILICADELFKTRKAPTPF